MTHQRIQLARDAESLAAAYLRSIGLRIHQRNYTNGVGEIDIIASDPQRDDALVFVEVRSRSSAHGVAPLDSITASKQEQVRRVVEAYLGAAKLPRHRVVRIDAIGITFSSTGALIEHLVDVI